VFFSFILCNSFLASEQQQWADPSHGATTSLIQGILFFTNQRQGLLVPLPIRKRIRRSCVSSRAGLPFSLFFYFLFLLFLFMFFFFFISILLSLGSNIVSIFLDMYFYFFFFYILFFIYFFHFTFP
jgi:hypothetical protein